MAVPSTESYLQALNKVVESTSEDKLHNILGVLFANIYLYFSNLANRLALNFYKVLSYSELFTDLFSKYFNTKENIQHLEYKISLYQLYSLIYKLRRYGLLQKKQDEFFIDLKKILLSELDKDSQKLDKINKLIAQVIYANFEYSESKAKTNSNYRKVLLRFYQSKEIKKSYYKWIRSLLRLKDINIVEEAPKFYLSRLKNSGIKPPDDQIKYNFINKGVTAEFKSRNYIYQTLKWLVVFAALLTSIAQALVPAVLAAGPTGNLINFILVIGVPSAIIDMVLYDKYIGDIVKDFWHGRIFMDAIDLDSDIDIKNKNKFNYLNVIILLISLCGGMVAGALAFTSVLTSLQAIFAAMLPGLTVATCLSLAYPLALVMAISTFLSLTSLFFGSLVELGHGGILNQLDNFYKKFFKDKSIINILLNIILLVLILTAALYLTTVESSILFVTACEVMGSSSLASLVTLIAIPANLLFTIEIYYKLCDMLYNLPSNFINFCKYIISNYNNPIALYEDIKWLGAYVFLLLLNIDNSHGMGKGTASEMTCDHCHTVLNKIHINSKDSIAQAAAYITDVPDCFMANLVGSNEAVRSPVVELYKKLPEHNSELNTGTEASLGLTISN